MPGIVGALRLAVLLGAVPLAACGGDKMSRPIGLSRDAPNDLAVFNDAPLSRPPDFAIRPPRTGNGAVPDTIGASTSTPAPVDNAASDSTDAGEQALVDAAGPPAPNNIRREVDRDAQVDQVDRSFSDRIMAWRPPAGGPSPIIQATPPSGFWSSIF